MVAVVSSLHKQTLTHYGFLFSFPVRLTGPGPGAVLAGGLFAASRLSWQWSVVAEVFALNNLFIGLLLVLTASFHCAENAQQRMRVTRLASASPTGCAHCSNCTAVKNARPYQVARWGALCCALGLCNQHTLVLYVVVVAPWVLHRLYSHGVSFFCVCLINHNAAPTLHFCIYVDGNYVLLVRGAFWKCLHLKNVSAS